MKWLIKRFAPEPHVAWLQIKLAREFWLRDKQTLLRSLISKTSPAKPSRWFDCICLVIEKIRSLRITSNLYCPHTADVMSRRCQSIWFLAVKTRLILARNSDACKCLSRRKGAFHSLNKGQACIDIATKKVIHCDKLSMMSTLHVDR